MFVHDDVIISPPIKSFVVLYFHCIAALSAKTAKFAPYEISHYTVIVDILLSVVRTAFRIFFQGGRGGKMAVPAYQGEANSICQSHTINLKGGANIQQGGGGGECPSPPPPPKCSPGGLAKECPCTNVSSSPSFASSSC